MLKRQVGRLFKPQSVAGTVGPLDEEMPIGTIVGPLWFRFWQRPDRHYNARSGVIHSHGHTQFQHAVSPHFGFHLN